MWPQDELWQRLDAFSLDIEGASLPFSARLARDNDWSLDFAARVALEYKKFLYLACTSGHVVTPSDEVDQAWHLHLTYSRSYWDELCAKVLQRPMHHDPTRGGKSEGQKFENFYERALESYRVAFGTTPPSDIWPPSHIRFGEAAHFRRVNLKRNWVIPRPQFPKPKPKALLQVIPALLLLLVLAGCSRSGSLNPYDWYGDEFLTLFAGMCFVGLGGAFWMRSKLSVPSDENFPATPLDPYRLARLSDTGTLPVDAALSALNNQGLIRIETGQNIEQIGITAPTDPFELAVWNSIGGQSSLAEIRQKVRAHLERFDAELLQLGFLVSPEAKLRAQSWPIGVSLALIAFGFIKIMVGMSRNRPVGILSFACLALLVFACVMGGGFAPRRSRRGELYLQKLRLDHEYLRTPRISPVGTAAFVGSEVAFMMALWGYSVLPTDLRTIYLPPSSSGGGDGGGGCGGGGGGCGGGGCGGCGGG